MRNPEKALPEYEVFAIRYATRDALRWEHFTFGADPHDAPMPMDYFVWVAISAGRAVLIDCGFTEETSKKRGRTFLRCPVRALELVGVDGNRIEDVVITHLHYDHVGNFHNLPNAKFHLQEREMHFAVGRHIRYPFVSASYNPEDVAGIVLLNYAQRVHLYNSVAEIAPGITAHPIGGHTPGMQFVRVHTRRGWVVLASDAAHFYENITLGRPFPAAFNNFEVLEAVDAMTAAAESPDHVVPGHDPAVLRRYPPPSADLEGIVARLDVAPTPL